MRRDIIQRVASSAGAHPKIPAPQLCHISSVCDGGAVGLASCSGQRSLTAATPACRGGHRWGRGEAGEGRGLCRPRQPGAPVHVALWATPCQAWHHQALGRKGLCSQRPLHAPSPAPPELVTGRVPVARPSPRSPDGWARGQQGLCPPTPRLSFRRAALPTFASSTSDAVPRPPLLGSLHVFAFPSFPVLSSCLRLPRLLPSFLAHSQVRGGQGPAPPTSVCALGGHPHRSRGRA